MIVEAKNLQKIYKNNRGIHDANFTIRKGRIVALAGGNGAGKSTLIRLLTKQEKPTNGELIWHQDDFVRYMPDDVDFPSTLTAQEVLGLLASLKKVGKGEQDEILKVHVTGIRKYDTFKKMYEDIPFKDFDCEGWTLKEMIDGTYEIYTPEQEKEWGTLAITISFIERNIQS